MWNLRRAREALLDTFGDVRMDGTLASISGTNYPHILITKSLYEYIDRTKDYSLLMEENTYFEDGRNPSDQSQRVGSLLEHVLLLNLIAFYKDPYCEEQEKCLMACVEWLNELQTEKGIRHIDLLTELVCLLEHREEMLDSEEYRGNMLEKYASPNQICFAKSQMPISQVVDSLQGKIQWIKDTGK